MKSSVATALMLSAALYGFGCGTDDDGELPPPLGQQEGGVTVPGTPGGTTPDGGAGPGPGTGGSPGGSPGGNPGGPGPSFDAGGGQVGQPSTDGGGSGPNPSEDGGSGNPSTDSGPGEDPEDDGGPSGPSTDGGPSADAGPGPGPGGSPGGSGDSSCLDTVTDYFKAGPFKFAAKTSGSIKMWVPTVPAGCKVPVVHLANGTGANCATYRPVLERLASHGFLAACYESTNTGAGKQGVQAIDTARTMYPDLVSNKIGSTGHSQGGQAAFTVLQQAEAKWGDSFTYAGLAMQPASGFGEQPSPGPWQTVYSKIKSPMFMFSGTSDILVSAAWVMQAFNALADNIEAYNWSCSGSTHIPVPNTETMEVAIPWFRWKLLGDQKACAAFQSLKMGKCWREVKSQNPKTCQ